MVADSITTAVGPAASRTACVLYDGQCPLCLKAIGILRRLDWLRRLHYFDARVPAALPEGARTLPPERLLEEMHLLTPGARVYHGFAAFRWLAWRLPLLWLAAPLLYLPGVPWFGQRFYLWVARNRFHLVPCHGGVCTLNHNAKGALAPGAPANDEQDT